MRAGANRVCAATSFALVKFVPTVTAARVSELSSFSTKGKLALKVTVVPEILTFWRGSEMGVFCWLMYWRYKLEEDQSKLPMSPEAPWAQLEE